MNLQENIQRIKTMMGLIIEEEGKSNYKGTNRIILIGTPTIGKSTVAQEISKELDIEYVQLDKLQGEYGYGSGKELELVKDVLSPKFKKYNTPSILDFGGGHVYNKGIDKLLSDYSNVFLLTPSNDYNESKEILKKGNYERYVGFMDQIIQGLKSGEHKHTKEKEEKLDYKQRKKLGIQTCLEIITTDCRFNAWTTFFNKHAKKDDLSDCFLQGMWFIKYKT